MPSKLALPLVGARPCMSPHTGTHAGAPLPEIHLVDGNLALSFLKAGGRDVVQPVRPAVGAEIVGAVAKTDRCFI